MKQQRIQPKRPKQTATDVEDVVVERPDAALLSEIDGLLDEIDAVLEDQAVLCSYRQRSGQ